MATERQSIENINDLLNNHLYDVEKGDIRKNVRDTQIKKSLNQMNMDLTSNDKVDPLDVITSIIHREREGGKLTAKQHELGRRKTLENLNNAFKMTTGNVEDVDRIARYNDYRIIDQYIPEITDCLDVLRDSILSPDDISKKAILYSYDGKLNESDRKIFDMNMNELFDKYNLEKYISEKIRSTLLLGDGFTIVSSMAKEFTKLLNEDIEDEDYGVVLNESMIDVDPKLRSSIHEIYESITKDKTKSKSLKENVALDFEKYLENTKRAVADKLNSNVKFIRDPYKMISSLSKYRDGFMTQANLPKELDINGVYFKSLKPDDVIKLEIDNVCIGYLVINRSKPAGGGTGGMHNTSSGSVLDMVTSAMNPDGGSSSSSSTTTSFSTTKTPEEVLKQGNTALAYSTVVDMLVQGISKKIDNKFVEKNEQFRDMVFALVKADYILNREVEITFMEPGAIDHVKIDSLDTYGVSRIASSLFPAKLYLGLLMTNMMVKINQGRDKRVFYIETGIDADVESNVEQLIKDTKSMEIPTSAFSNSSSVSTVLNTVGALENYYIPVVEGSRPFDIDTISGISVDINDELQDKLLKSSIIGTGVPYNYIDASADLDFARSLSMQNQGFVKKVVNYQQEFSKYFTDIIRKMYEFEFGDTEHDKKRSKRSKVEREEQDELINRIDINNIQIVFPEPIVLNMSTNNEQIESTNTTIDYITDLYIDGSTEDVDEQKRKFKKKLAQEVFMKNLDWEKFDNLFEEMKEDAVMAEIENFTNEDTEEGEDDSYGGSDF